MNTARRPIKSRDAKWAERMASALAEKGVRPNQISIASVFFALAAALALVAGERAGGAGRSALLAAAILGIQGRLLCNLLDGMVAIEGGFKTPSGAIFNDLPDRIADPLILIALGYAAGIPTLGWLAGLLAVLTAYVRYLGAAAGATELFIGPMAKQHRMAVCTIALAVSALAPDRSGSVISAALILISAGCVVTAARRASRIVRELEAE